MRNFRKVSFWKFAVSVGLLLVGAQGVCAQQNQCKGTVYFKAPADWASAYIGGYNVNKLTAMTKNSEGFYKYDLSLLGITDANHPYFSIGNQLTASATLQIITSTGFGVAPKAGTNDSNWPTNDASLRCPGEGNHVYIFENPAAAGKTQTGLYPPGAKFLYMMIPPDYTEWLSADPMISWDGGATGEKLEAVDGEDYCGWFRYVWTGGTIPENVVFYSSADEARTNLIGMYGNWEEPGVVTPVPLARLFELVDTLYFVLLL